MASSSMPMPASWRQWAIELEELEGPAPTGCWSIPDYAQSADYRTFWETPAPR